MTLWTSTTPFTWPLNYPVANPQPESNYKGSFQYEIIALSYLGAHLGLDILIADTGHAKTMSPYRKAVLWVAVCLVFVSGHTCRQCTNKRRQTQT